jgi:L-malate glycosyltransferase
MNTKPRSIKLLLISNMYPSVESEHYGIFVKNFVESLRDSNIQIISQSLICGRGKGVFSKLFKYLRFYISIVCNMLKFNYDMIYIHFPTYSCLPLRVFLPIISKPIILNFHGGDAFPASKLSQILYKLTFPLVKKANTIVVPSGYFKKVVMDKFVLADDKVFISPSAGVDMNMFRPLVENEKNNQNFTVGYVSRVDEGKGWDILLKAIHLLKTEISNIKCLIVGSGLQVYELERMIIELGLQKEVKYFGAVAHEKLNQAYNMFDVFIFPTTLNESLGLVGIEALACGVPIIGSRIGGLEDYITEDLNGYFFTPKQEDELAIKILKYYNEQPVFCNIRETVLRYDTKKVASDLISKLESISNNSSFGKKHYA